jgi:predicted esterase
MAAATHGRYLVAEPPADITPRGLIVGCHGYAESAEVQLDRLNAIAGSDAWVRVSVQGLHRFYRGASRDVVASWMTREDRELSIQDNVAYVLAVAEAVGACHPAATRLIFAGFSQGVAMAWRAACASPRLVAGIIGLGGDVPPELSARELRQVAHAFLGRGDRDPWYSPQQFAADHVRLRDADVDLTAYCFDDEHVWSPVFSDAAGHFLHRLESSDR